MSSLVQESSNSKHSIAIIGGGVSGLLVAINILQQDSAKRIRVFLFERNSNQIARGIAYAQQSSLHLLNVIAERMSLYPQEPQHFVNWLKQNSYGYGGKDYVPRVIYGNYLAEQKDILLQNYSDRIFIIEDEITDLEFQPTFVQLLGAKNSYICKQLVLATGNQAPTDLPICVNLQDSQASYFSNPWSIDPQVILGAKSVCLLGSGLTSLDILVDLLRQDYKEQIFVLSRRGLLPQPHPEEFNPVYTQLPKLEGALSSKTKTLHRWLKQNLSQWQLHFDLLRPVTQQLWQELSALEQQRFLRHLTPFWDTHRHRVDPQIDQLVRAAVARGQLKLLAGRILETSYDSQNEVINLKFRSRFTGAIQEISSQALINCTGPASFKSHRQGLFHNLLKKQKIKLDPLQIGLLSDPAGRVLNADLQQQRLWALGTLRKGQLWESNAVNELRLQAQVLAKAIIEGCYHNEIKS